MVNLQEPLLVLGFGGHARSVADVALAYGFEQLIFLDEQAKPDEYFLNFPVLNTAPEGVKRCLLAAGNHHFRAKQRDWALKQAITIHTLVAKTASMGVGSILGAGTFVGQHAHVGPLTQIGNACIINTAAVVEHDCYVGDFSHISVNTTLAGRVRVGQRVFVGAGAVVKDGVSICDDVTIGAGAVVVKSITEPGVYVGVPAQIL